MKTMVIGFSGKIGSGKTTTEKALTSFVEDSGVSVHVLRFADPIKRFVDREILPYDLKLENDFSQEAKNKFIPDLEMTVGQFMQKFGTDAMRNGFSENIWVNLLSARVKSIHNNSSVVRLIIIPDVRFPNELEYFSKEEDGIGKMVFRLEGDPGKVRANSNRDLNHPSETALDGDEYLEKFDDLFNTEISSTGEIVDTIMSYITSTAMSYV